MVMPAAHSTVSAVTDGADPAAGSTPAAGETLQGVISPGSGSASVYAASGAVVASASSTAMELDVAATDSVQLQQFQMSATASAVTTQLSIPPPIAILAPVDQRTVTQQARIIYIYVKCLNDEVFLRL